jgi:hypothetical protein
MRATKETPAGRRYLELQREARRAGRPTDAADATAESIRDEDAYSGVRVTLAGKLSRAVVSLHVHINIGDPIWPEPQKITLPRPLSGTLSVRGYPLEMVLAEKIVTSIARGTANTRWRDFVDIYTLVQRHHIDGPTLKESMRRVARYRGVTLSPLKAVLEGYEEIAQSRWLAWLRKQRLDAAIPNDFSAVLNAIEMFSDPAISNVAIQTCAGQI